MLLFTYKTSVFTCFGGYLGYSLTRLAVSPVLNFFGSVSSQTGLHAGDWVEIKQPDEIALTLDADGALDGLPFMPEMVEYCGHRMRVIRKAEKTCTEGPKVIYEMREFIGSDVVLLEGNLRCSGAAHGGCQRVCQLFWKTAWLRPVASNDVAPSRPRSNPAILLAKLKTLAAPDRYFCQSTELLRATQPITSWQRLQKCWYEYRFGSFSVFKAISLIVVPQFRKFMLRYRDPSLRGTLTKTPVEKLDLKAGELVEIKSPEEIAQTIDKLGRNRGLRCDSYAVRSFAGKEVRVRTRLDRMINESTGVMHEMQNTVILDGIGCECPLILGGCPRRDPAFWREIWLKRAGPVTEKS